MIYALPLRIIHLDDSFAFRKGVLSSCIQPFLTNHELIEFENGDEAYKFIKTEISGNKKIDLIITDINHYGLRGNELAKAIRLYEEQFKSSHRIPIIVLTMVEEKVHSELIANNIVDAYLSKSASVEDVISCIQKLLVSDN